MATVFFQGASELATLTNTFTVNGSPTDPTTVSLIVTDPTQTATTYTYAAAQISKTGTGVYTKDISCAIAGTWTYEWTGTTAASDVVAGTWEVQETSLGKLYCTVEALKSSFKDVRNVDDLEYHSACFSASRALETYCQRSFYRTASQTRTLNPTGAYCLELPPFYDLVSVSSIQVGGSAWGTSSYQLLCDDNTPNIDAGPEQKPYVKIKAIGGTYPAPAVSSRTDVVEVTGVWGWPAVPWAIKKAAEIVAAETFKLKDSPGMVAAGFEDFDVQMLGSEARRRFARFANPYRRHAFLAA
jgi:hypothetical protein